MIKNYWVQYRYRPLNWSTEDGWEVLSEFVTIDKAFIQSEFSSLEAWWDNESKSCVHELLQVVKL